jgi:heme/copper-type cytochrome/quinol oxidase subunit 3
MASHGEDRPLGMMVPVPAGVDIPPEPPDVAARTLLVASRMMCGATTFFFLAFAFAYFYLRSLNQDHMWRTGHMKPAAGLGVAFIVCVVLSVVLVQVASRAMRQSSPSWLGAAIGATVLGLAAIVFQCLEFTSQNFGPTDGAYASVFCAWLAFYMIAVLATMYWLETQIATELRARSTPAGSEGDLKEPDRLIAPGLDAATFYWSFLGAIGVLTYVVLYLL